MENAKNFKIQNFTAEDAEGAEENQAETIEPQDTVTPSYSTLKLPMNARWSPISQTKFLMNS